MTKTTRHKNDPVFEHTMWDRDLLTAARCGHLNLAKTALKNGARVNAFDKNLNTPLILACANHHDEVATYLISQGADLSWESLAGTNAYMCALNSQANELAEVIGDLMENQQWEEVTPVMAPEPAEQELVLTMDNTEVKPTYKHLEVLSFGPRLKVYQCYSDLEGKVLVESPLGYFIRFDGVALGLIQEISLLISVKLDHSHKRIIRFTPQSEYFVGGDKHKALLENLRAYCREYNIEFLEVGLGTALVREPRLTPESSASS